MSEKTFKQRVIEAGEIIRESKEGYVWKAAQVHGIHPNNLMRYLDGKPKKEKGYEAVLKSIKEAVKIKRDNANKVHSELANI